MAPITKFLSQRLYEGHPQAGYFPFEFPQRGLLRFCLLLGLSVLFFLLLVYRIDRAPDIHLDELLYYRAAFNLANTGEFTWRENPVLVHPPLYFLTQAGFLHLVGQAERFDPFLGIASVRLLNALLGAMSIIVLFRLVKRLGGLRAALLASSLFIFDPFVLRINRRNIIETMAEFWVLLGLYLFWRERERLKWPQMILIGTIFGCALLTKELAIFGLAVLPLFILLSKRWQDIKKVGAICGVALGVWGLVPFWAWSIAHGQAFIENKSFNIRRLLGLIQTTGWNRPDVSFVNALEVHLEQYGTSYLLILLGGLLMLVLWRTWRDERGRFVLAWAGMMYLFSAYIIVAGTLNEFFFYYLMPPVVVVVGTMTSRAANWLACHPWRAHVQLVIVLFLLAIQSYNVYRWAKLFALEDDRALYELTEYISETLPPGTSINSMFHANNQLLPLNVTRL